jgi:trehalose 6-phosphate synthase/phosphatase
MEPITEALATTVPIEAQRETNLLVASNRLPVLLRREDDGSWRSEAGSGGLVTALDPVLRRLGGTWVGWPGVLEGEAHELKGVLETEFSREAYRVEPVWLTRHEQRFFYLGFCNEVLWPLFHGLLDRCRFEARYWDVYKRVNRKYAAAIMRAAEPDQLIWVQDYHLMMVGEELRAAGVQNRTGFFLHIPFPPPDLFERLPWGREILKALVSFDVLGFQTRRDWRNFLDCIRLLRPSESRVHGDVVLSRNSLDRPTRVGVHPISIEYSAFAEPARSEAVAARVEELRRELNSEYVLLGVDRLDYTKGLPEKLAGYERALERFPELRGRTKLVQLIIPSRARIPEYHRLKDRLDRMVGQINGRFTRRGWVPIHYEYGSWSPCELLSFYRGADAALVTPLRDGMNLVAKEYVAASVERGALVLSDFAGSAEELRDGALLVNPHDVEGVAEAIHRAVTLPQQEQRARLAQMQAWIAEHDVHRWVRGFLTRAAEDPETEAQARKIAALWVGSSSALPRIRRMDSRSRRGAPRPSSRPSPALEKPAP